MGIHICSLEGCLALVVPKLAIEGHFGYPAGMPAFGAQPGGALPGLAAAFPNVMVPGMPSAPLPGAFPGAFPAGFPAGFSGVMQQPAPAAMAASQPAAVSTPAGPNEGWVKLRGIPFTAGKQDLITFFQVSSIVQLQAGEA